MVGGTGSLTLPGKLYATPLDDRQWWLAFRRIVANSASATALMVNRCGGNGPLAELVQKYRDARLALKDGRPKDEDCNFIQSIEDAITKGPDPFPDLPKAARAALLMFKGNTSFKWSFLSPPGGFRPGKKTGTYEIRDSVLPVRTDFLHLTRVATVSEMEAAVLGISICDLATAIVDEVENQL